MMDVARRKRDPAADSNTNVSWTTQVSPVKQSKARHANFFEVLGGDASVLARPGEAGNRLWERFLLRKVAEREKTCWFEGIDIAP